MLATINTNLFAGYGCDTGPRINDKKLRLLMRPHIHLSIEVFQMGGIPLQADLLQAQVVKA